MALRRLGLCLALLASASLLGGWGPVRKCKKKRRCAQRVQRCQPVQRQARVVVVRRAPVAPAAPKSRTARVVKASPATQPQAAPESVTVAVKLPATTVAPKVTVTPKSEKAVVVKTKDGEIAPATPVPAGPAPTDEAPAPSLDDIVVHSVPCCPTVRRPRCRPRLTLGQLLGLCCRPRCCPPVPRCCAGQMPIDGGGGLLRAEPGK
jgi:hypothetical protein